jgi:hypothetical protein
VSPFSSNEDWRWASARGHLGLAPDPLVDPAPARARIDDWRGFLDAGLDPVPYAALRAAAPRPRRTPPRSWRGR